MTRPQWIAVGVTFALSGAGVYGLYRLATRYWDFGAADADLPAAVRAYRGDGLPFVAGDLLPTRPRPEGNAVPAIRAAVGAMPPRATDARLATELKRLDPASDAVLALYRSPLSRIEAAEDRPRVDFDRDWDRGTHVLFPEFATMKTLAKAAALRALFAASRGDDASALRSLTLARRLAFWAGEEPALIPMFVRITIEGTALDGAEGCLALVAAYPERIAHYRRWLTDAPPLPRYGDALRGEGFIGVATLRNLEVTSTAGNDEGEARIDTKRLVREGLPDDEKVRAFLCRHLQVWSEAFRATDGFGATPEAIDREFKRLDDRLEREKGLSYSLEGWLLATFQGAGRSIRALEARRAVRRAFAEALADHALTGRWPTRVAGTDPFTGGPLRVRAGKDFRVWSVGRDGHDDGGLLRREASKKPGSTYDEVAVYPPVPR